MIIDTSVDVSNAVPCLKAARVATIFRYYARETRLPEKRLTRREASAIIEAGLVLGAVFQSAGNGPTCFSGDIGTADAVHAVDHATTVIGQPPGSAIYFAVDYDPPAEDIGDRILPYFAAVGAVLLPVGFRIGIYGNGAVCAPVLAAGQATLAWRSDEPGEAEVVWHLRQGRAETLCGLPVDRNDLRPGCQDIGTFDRLDRVP